jgi:hypothetical protein
MLKSGSNDSEKGEEANLEPSQHKRTLAKPKKEFGWPYRL